MQSLLGGLFCFFGKCVQFVRTGRSDVTSNKDSGDDAVAMIYTEEVGGFVRRERPSDTNNGFSTRQMN